jgi:hypothetical protein
MLAWLKETVQEDGNIWADELDLVTMTDDPAEVVRIIKKAHVDSGFDDTAGATGGI